MVALPVDAQAQKLVVKINRLPGTASEGGAVLFQAEITNTGIVTSKDLSTETG